MVRKLIEWAVNNPLVTILLVLGLAGGGVYAFLKVNVEAYPDPAPAIIEAAPDVAPKSIVYQLFSPSSWRRSP